MPITPQSEYTLTQPKWEILNDRPKTPNYKETKEWIIINTMHMRYQQIKLAENKLKLANTQFVAKQALNVVWNVQPEQPKRKKAKHAFAKEAENSEITRQILQTWHSFCTYPNKPITTSIQLKCHNCTKHNERTKTK